MTNTPNPETKSNNAMLLFCIGAGILALAYFLGFGAMVAALLSGGDPAAIAGGLVMAIGLGLAAASGFVLMLIGGVWMIVRVIADQSGGDRYSKNVER